MKNESELTRSLLISMVGRCKDKERVRIDSFFMVFGGRWV